MKKASQSFIAIVIGFLFIASSSLSAQAIAKNDKVADSPKKATLTWDKSKHVFGSIEHKVPVYAEFTFTNDSKAPVAITKVGVTCGCTSPSYTKKPIQPGKKGTIKIRYDGAAPGFFKKGAKVHFSDGTEKEIEIEGKVVVRRQNLK